MSKVHIIGAGLAGLAAAVKLIKSGQEVLIYEATPHAGGRCRSYFDAVLGRVIDNGNHLILGSNRHALAYINAIGSQDSFITRKHPRYAFIDLVSDERWEFQPLWVAQTLSRLAFAREARTVSECVNTSSALYRRFIEPFCISALNTEPGYASATLLRRTLWEIIKCGRRGLRYYLPKRSLSESLIDPALKIIEAGGGKIHYNSAVKSLEWNGNRLTDLQFADRQVDVSRDNVILAATVQAAAKLIPDAQLFTESNAIVNGHFICPGLPWPEETDFIGVTGGTVQWIFYRDGVLSTTSSAANSLANKDSATIAGLLWNDVQSALKFSLPLPRHRIISEKQATIAAVPMKRTILRKTYGNLILAGDYTEANLPATIDSAVKSGLA